ncbi:MAG: hypothetical protein NTX59_02515 [Elusimicrobia bacterium]|nr:hypothetical protein [Elusimicrobiota bacterium]
MTIFKKPDTLCREFNESTEKAWVSYSKLDIPLGFSLHHCPDFRRGGVSIISSRPRQGKTAFIISVLNNLITSGKFNAAVFLPDMPTAEFFSRLTASRAGVAYSKVKRGTITRDDWLLLTKAIPALSKTGLWVSASKRFSSNSVRTEALGLVRELKREKNKLDVIFIDSVNYLSDFPERSLDKTAILHALRRLAEDTDTAVVCAYGLNELKPDGLSPRACPKLRDFRARGIFEDAVGIILNIRMLQYRVAGIDSKEDVSLDIVWSNTGKYGHSIPASFDCVNLMFYAEKLPPGKKPRLNR